MFSFAYLEMISYGEFLGLQFPEDNKFKILLY